MPKENVIQFLQKSKSDPKIKKMKKIIFTNFPEEYKSFQKTLKVDDFIIKSNHSLSSMIDIIRKNLL